MSSGQITNKNIESGNASRYVRPEWVKDGTLLTIAFDLREGPPPEDYVSHFLVSGVGLGCFTSAYEIISGKLSCKRGSIAMLDISEALLEVNDELEPFIKFVDKKLPHCGLIYVTNNQSHIQEVKATLCLLAQEKIMPTEDIISALAPP